MVSNLFQAHGPYRLTLRNRFTKERIEQQFAYSARFLWPGSALVMLVV